MCSCTLVQQQLGARLACAEWAAAWCTAALACIHYYVTCFVCNRPPAGATRIWMVIMALCHVVVVFKALTDKTSPDHGAALQVRAAGLGVGVKGSIGLSLSLGCGFSVSQCPLLPVAPYLGCECATHPPSHAGVCGHVWLRLHPGSVLPVSSCLLQQQASERDVAVPWGLRLHAEHANTTAMHHVSLALRSAPLSISHGCHRNTPPKHTETWHDTLSKKRVTTIPAGRH